MADKITSTRTLKMVAEFGDGYEQNISQNDPTSDNLVQKINAFNTFAVNNNLFISEKSNATISRIKSAVIISQDITDYDIG